MSWLPYRLLLAVPGLGALRAPVRVEYVLVALLVAATVVALRRLLEPAPRRASGRRRGRGRVARHESARARCRRRASTRHRRATTRCARSPPGRAPGRHGVERARRLRSFVREPAGVPPHARGRVCGFLRGEPVVEARAYTASDAFTKLRCDRTHYGRLATTAGRRPAPFGATRRRRAAPRIRRAVRRHRPIEARGRVRGGRPALPGAARVPARSATTHRFEVIDLDQPAGLPVG